MGVTYFKRFRMEIDLTRVRLTAPVLPAGYEWVAWSPAMLGRHADAKYSSFRAEIDSEVFPVLGQSEGCLRLMQEISRRPTFLPRATWLISHAPGEGRLHDDCGTIQGISHPGGLGAVQNVGVAPPHRGLGLGRALVLKALDGFREARMVRVYLEVTAQNTPAVQLYRSLGFRLTRTTYKAVDQPTSTCTIS